MYDYVMTHSLAYSLILYDETILYMENRVHDVYVVQ